MSSSIRPLHAWLVVLWGTLSLAGCPGVLCPSNGYDDGYEAGRRYVEIMYASGESLDSLGPPRIGSAMLEWREYYRVPEEFDCPDYDYEFSAGMMDGMSDAMWDLGQGPVTGQ